MLRIWFLLVSIILTTGCSNDELTRFSQGVERFGKAVQGVPNSQQNNYNNKALNNQSDGIPVYSPNQCIGAQVNGQCHGSVMGAPMATCHGQMLNGQCTGPIF